MIYLLQIHKEHQHKLGGKERGRAREREGGRKRVKHD